MLNNAEKYVDCVISFLHLYKILTISSNFLKYEVSVDPLKPLLY